jgi:hypothetical protein
MKAIRHIALAAVAGICLAGAMSQARAQVDFAIGPEPTCPYGFYDYAPYACAPSGYYGPEWFLGGLFIGAGPWFHGREPFRGRVDNHFDDHHGYSGPMPGRGDLHDPALHAGRMADFAGNEMHDAGGHGFGGGLAGEGGRGGGFGGGGGPGEGGDEGGFGGGGGHGGGGHGR